MNRRKFFIPAVLAALLLGGCAAPSAETLPTLIPQPQEVAWSRGTYRLPAQTRIGITDPLLAPQADYLTEALAPYTEAVRSETASGDIELGLDTAALADEAYRLAVTGSGVRITGGSPRGVVNAIATLRQLLPAGKGAEGVIPCAEVSDAPAFAWRGVMLDVSRHFFDKEEICSLLDQMARLKLNKFHWHLTDDQGWRIEIKAYPDLAGKGGWRHYNKHDTICMGVPRERRMPISCSRRSTCASRAPIRSTAATTRRRRFARWWTMLPVAVSTSSPRSTCRATSCRPSSIIPK